MIMKTLKYITLVLGISLFSSCLDEEPKYSMDMYSLAMNLMRKWH